MNAAPFLSPEELVELTGLVQPAAQVRWLVRNGLRHFVRADGRPVVTRHALEHAEERLSSAPIGPDLDAVRIPH